jgi:hypothetical protein
MKTNYSLRSAKPPPAGIDEHTYRIIDGLDCLKAQLVQMMLAEAISRACS